MRLNNVKRAIAAKRFRRSKQAPVWVRRATDRKAHVGTVRYNWRSDKLKV